MTATGPTQIPSSTFDIKVDGGALESSVAADFVSGYVEDSRVVPDMFVLRFKDEHRTAITKGKFAIGAKVTVSVKTLEGSQTVNTELIDGEVTAVEREMIPGAVGTVTTVRGYDRGHRLFRGTHTKGYPDATYDDVVKAVAGKLNLSGGKVDPTKTVHEHVPQLNVSHGDFLVGMAREVGFEINVTAKSIDFKKPADATSSGAATLTLRPENLLRYRVTVSSAEQVTEVQVRGWDYHKKQKIAVTAPAATTATKLKVQPKEMAAKFGSPKLVETSVPYGHEAAAAAAARGRAEAVASAAFELEGVARAQPKLRAGTVIALEETGDPFDGAWSVTTTRHTYDPYDGYTVGFKASGRVERTMWDMAGSGDGGSNVLGAPRIHGVITALVSDIKDPKKLGRVKLAYPWLDDSYVSDWARVAQVGAGKKGSGFFVMPEVKDEVVVAFEQGDVRKPIVLAGVFNGVDKPQPVGKMIEGDKIASRHYRSAMGHTLIFHDNKGSKEGIYLYDSTEKQGVKINSKDKSVEVWADTSITIVAQAKEVKIQVVKAGGSISMKADKIELDGKMGVNIKSGAGPIDLKGTGPVTVESKAMTTIKGTAVTVKAMAAAKVESTGPMTIKGLPVMIN